MRASAHTEKGKKMPRLINADVLIEQIKNPYTEYPIMIKIRKAIEDMINETPTVEAEPVVRCKDCKYLEEDECPWTGVIDWNGYCSRGEKRKESGQNA